MLTAHQLSLSPRLLPLSIRFQPGQVTHLIGPNGSGKSTLLHLLSGLGTPEHGQVSIQDTAIAGLRRQDLAHLRGYLIQQQKPAFVMAVYEYLNLVIDSLQLGQVSARDAVVRRVCQSLSIDDKLHRRVDSLSGGEWQRVRLAGVLLQVDRQLNPQASVLLLDEPATGLDVAQQEAIYSEITHAAKQGLCVVMANHDLNRSLTHADNVVLLNQGRMVASGAPRDVLSDTRLSDVFATPLVQVSTAYGPVIVRVGEQADLNPPR